MIIGLSIETFTLLHVVVSLAGIATGTVWLAALAGGRWLGAWNAVFLAATVSTTLTGFLFPIGGFTPALGVGLLSSVLLAIALAALIGFGRAGGWHRVYVVCAAIGLYFNAFVAVVQAFQKIPPLHDLAPAGTEPPFALAQGATLIFFAGLGFFAFRRRLAAVA